MGPDHLVRALVPRGTDAAIESAGVTLLRGDLNAIARDLGLYIFRDP